MTKFIVVLCMVVLAVWFTHLPENSQPATATTAPAESHAAAYMAEWLAGLDAHEALVKSAIDTPNGQVFAALESACPRNDGTWCAGWKIYPRAFYSGMVDELRERARE